MLNRGKISELQQKATKNISEPDSEKNQVRKYTMLVFDEALELCQKYITKIATNAYRRESDPSRKREIAKRYINEFVDSQKPIVQKPSGNGTFEVVELKHALIDEISHYGPITKAMEDPLIDEIRANAPDQIFVESSGKTIRWDQKFTDREHMERII